MKWLDGSRKTGVHGQCAAVACKVVKECKNCNNMENRRLPFPTSMLLELERRTLQCKNELWLANTVAPLELPRKNTETQPPPATALRDALCCCDCCGTLATAALFVIKQCVI